MTGPPASAQLIVGNGHVVRFDTEEIDGEYVTRAEQELRETPANRLAGIEGLRELLKADTDLKFPYDDESRLLIFLRPCKFYPQSAYELLKRYYMFRLKHPKVYLNLTPVHEKNLFDQNILTVLPRRDHMGRKILLIETGSKWNTSLCKVDEIFRGCALFLEAAMAEPKSQTSGVVVMIDQAGLTLSHVMQFTPNFARAVVSWAQDCLPVRLKAVHIVNQPYIFNMLFALFKPFLREKLRKRIIFHGSDKASLLKHIHAETLPPRYGGTLECPEVTSAQWYSLMEPRNADFELLNDYGYSSDCEKK